MTKQLEALIARAKHIVENGGLLARDTSLQLIAALEQAQQHENVHYADAAEVEIASLRKRIAELEASPLAVKLPTQEKYDDPLSAHKAIKDCAEAIRAAGGTVEGE